MLSLAAFCNRTLDKNISITICCSLVPFIRGLSGALPAQLPAVPVPVRRGTISRAAGVGLGQLLCATDSLCDLGQGTSSQLAAVNRR